MQATTNQNNTRRRAWRRSLAPVAATHLQSTWYVTNVHPIRTDITSPFGDSIIMKHPEGDLPPPPDDYGAVKRWLEAPRRTHTSGAHVRGHDNRWQQFCLMYVFPQRHSAAARRRADIVPSSSGGGLIAF